MSRLPNSPLAIRVCPFCGVATDVNHETQEGCIAALHEEIARMRGILAHLKPAGAPITTGDDHDAAKAIRVALD